MVDSAARQCDVILSPKGLVDGSHALPVNIVKSLSVGYMTYMSEMPYGQEILEFHANEKSALAQAVSRSSPFEMQLYFNELMDFQCWMHKELFDTFHKYNIGMQVI